MNLALLLAIAALLLGLSVQPIMKLVVRLYTRNFRSLFLGLAKEVGEAKSELRKRLMALSPDETLEQPAGNLPEVSKAMETLGKPLRRLKLLCEDALGGWSPIFGSLATKVPHSKLRTTGEKVDRIVECLKSAEGELRKRWNLPLWDNPLQAWDALVQVQELMDEFKEWTV